MSVAPDNDDRHPGETDDDSVVRLDRVSEKIRRQRSDARAQELATRFHRAMGWKGTPDAPAKNGRGKSKRNKKKS